MLKNIDCGYSLEPPLCFERKYEKLFEFLSENLPFLVVKFSIYMYLNRRVFVKSTSFKVDVYFQRVQSNEGDIAVGRGFYSIVLWSRHSYARNISQREGVTKCNFVVLI